MDDYLIATSSTIELHQQATHKLLDLIKKHDLFIKLEKCMEKCMWDCGSHHALIIWG